MKRSLCLQKVNEIVRRDLPVVICRRKPRADRLLRHRAEGDAMVGRDEAIARLRTSLKGRRTIAEKAMFGGICFMLRDHMLCAAPPAVPAAERSPRRALPCRHPPSRAIKPIRW